MLVGATAAAAGGRSGFDLPAQPLGASLQRVAERFDLKIAFYNEFTDGLQAPPLRGEFTASEAFEALLADTRLEHIYVVRTTVAIRPRAAAAPTPKGGPSMNKTETNPNERRRNRAGTVRSFVAGLAATLLAGPGAAGEAEDGEDGKVEVIVVTGTRMKLPPAQQVNNVISWTADDLEAMGVATFEEVFRRLPQNLLGGSDVGGASSNRDFGGGGLIGIEKFNGTANVTGASTVNLRGIGERGTLILVDGKRLSESGMLGGFTDISTIPMATVARVEILLDGTSSVYGPDAIGGVVNIITKKDYEGVFLRIRHDGPYEEGRTRQNASLAGTYGWETGNLTATLNAYRTGALDRSKSNAVRSGAYGLTTEYGTVRGLGTDPGEPITTLTEAAQEAGLVGPDEGVSSASVPVNSDGVVTIDGFLPTVNNPMTSDDALNGQDSVLPAKTTYDVRLVGTQKIPGGFEVRAGVSFAPRKTTTFRHNFNLYTGVPGDNPHNPFDQTVLILKRVTDYPVTLTRAESEAWTLDLDFDGELRLFPWSENWEWRIESRRATIDTTTQIINEIRRDQLRALLGGKTKIDEDGLYQPDSTPRTREDGFYLNPFGPTLTAVNPPEILNEIISPPQKNDTSTETTSVNAYLRGDLWALPAGNLQAVVGAEWRRKALEFQYRTTVSSYARSFTNNGVGIRSFSNATNLDDQRAERAATAVYVEFFAPVLENVPLIRKMSVTVSGRRESSEGTGISPALEDREAVDNKGDYEYSTWQLGTSWEIVEGLRFYSSKHTSYITPTLLQLSVDVPDQRASCDFLCSIWGSRTAFEDQSVTPSVNYEQEGIPLPWILNGSNPDLQPERGLTQSAGLEWVPEYLPGLRVNLNYAKSELYDRIAVIPDLGFFGSVTITPELGARFPNAIHRHPDGEHAGYIESVDARAINIGYEETSNLDLQVEYRRPTNLGIFSVYIGVNKVALMKRLDSQNDEEGRTQKTATGWRNVERRWRDFLGEWGHLQDSYGNHCRTSAETAAFVADETCRAHRNELSRTLTSYVPKYSQHLNLGWEYRGLQINIDMSHRDNISYVVSDDLVLRHNPVSVNLSGSYDLTNGDLFRFLRAPVRMGDAVLRFGINDLLDQRVKTTINGEHEDDRLYGNFLDVSNRSYYLEISTTVGD